MAELILKTSEPERVKQLGKRVQGFNKKEWYRVSVEYMFQAMLAKFTQNEDLKGFLLATDGNRLLEANPTDRFWGIGLSLKSGDLYKETKWTGKNMAGRTLERVREALK